MESDARSPFNKRALIHMCTKRAQRGFFAFIYLLIFLFNISQIGYTCASATLVFSRLPRGRSAFLFLNFFCVCGEFLVRIEIDTILAPLYENCFYTSQVSKFDHAEIVPVTNPGFLRRSLRGCCFRPHANPHLLTIARISRNFLSKRRVGCFMAVTVSREDDYHLCSNPREI